MLVSLCIAAVACSSRDGGGADTTQSGERADVTQSGESVDVAGGVEGDGDGRRFSDCSKPE